jgi:hypothetical protein
MALTESKAARFTKATAFRLFKILIFAILMLNLFYYLYEDVTAYLYLAEDSSFMDAVESFAVTIDYVAWMVLIVLFEMETTAQAKDQFKGARKWVIAGLTAACYAVLVYAAYGYALGLAETFDFEPIESASVCDLTTQSYALLTEEGRPIELAQENCGAFAGEEVLKSPADKLIASRTNLLAIRRLGWVDVINAAAWLLVVLVFQIELSLELAKKLTRHRLSILMASKGAAYLGLLGCAIYWTIYSAFIDSWDAWVWLIAFVLIDLNLLGLDESQQPPVSGEVVEA